MCESPIPPGALDPPKLDTDIKDEEVKETTIDDLLE
jgi:hypothetical protein